MEKAKVIDFFGDKRQVHEFLGISRQAVDAWPETIPERMAARLHFMTNGQLQYNIDAYT